MVKKVLISVKKCCKKILNIFKIWIDRPAKNVYDVKTIIVRSGRKILKIVRVIRQFPCETVWGIGRIGKVFVSSK